MNKHLLVVDDEAPTRELLALFFRTRGFQVTAASNANDALQALGQHTFDVVMLDVDLGTSDGLDLLKPIKTNHPDLPVIIFTGLGHDEALMQRARDNGASGFLVKTQPFDQILREVQHVMGL